MNLLNSPPCTTRPGQNATGGLSIPGAPGSVGAGGLSLARRWTQRSVASLCGDTAEDRRHSCYSIPDGVLELVDGRSYCEDKRVRSRDVLPSDEPAR